LSALFELHDIQQNTKAEANDKYTKYFLIFLSFNVILKQKTLERFNIVPASFLFYRSVEKAYCAFAESTAVVSTVSTAAVSSAGAS
jgi:hypothetical protein